MKRRSRNRWIVRYNKKWRQIKNLPDEVKLLIDEAIECLKEEGPLPQGWEPRLINRKKKKYRLVLSKGKNQYRMVYYAHKQILVVEIIYSGHRKDAKRYYKGK